MSELRIDFTKLENYCSKLDCCFKSFQDNFSNSFFEYNFSSDEIDVLNQYQKRIGEKIDLIIEKYDKQIDSLNNFISEFRNIDDSLLNGVNRTSEIEIHNLLNKMPKLSSEIIYFGDLFQ